MQDEEKISDDENAVDDELAGNGIERLARFGFHKKSGRCEKEFEHP